MAAGSGKRVYRITASFLVQSVISRTICHRNLIAKGFREPGQEGHTKRLEGDSGVCLPRQTHRGALGKAAGAPGTANAGGGSRYGLRADLRTGRVAREQQA